MPINSFLYPGAKVTPVYEVANSLRINSGDDCKLSRTSPNSSPTNADKFTISFWIKRSNIDANSGHEHQQVFTTYDGSGSPYQEFQIYFTQNTLKIQTYNSSNQMELVTNRVFRDISSWYSIIFVYDSSQSTASNRAKLYINGVQETSFSTETYPSQNVDGEFAIQNHIQMIGNNSANTRDLGCYLAEFVGVDGQALAHTDFGEFDEDSPTIWKPIDVSGIDVGNLGFYLDFENSSALGTDASGVGNFSLTNLAAADQATDTCTNNFATFNLLDGTSTGTAFVLSEGNCKGVTAVDTNGALQSTMAVSSGKWYAEFKIAKVGDNLSGGRTTVGIGSRTNSQVSGNYYGNTASPIDSYGKYSASAHYYSNNGSTTSYGSSFVDDDIIGVYLDLDNNKLYFSENGTLYSSTGIDITAAASTLNGHYHIGVADASANDNGEYLANYGGCPAFTISSGNSDDNGYGNFEYSPNITGDGEAKKFYALCTKNLAEFG